jgi:CDP-glycerol glycerophosphotransferase (TagB/SpsB family)
MFLITDYSSVIFDFAYMKKPCAYFQYDKKLFEENQYAESRDYSYERDGFGPVYEEYDALLCGLRDSCKQGFKMEDMYKKRVEQYFQFFDDEHCARTVEVIKKHIHR